MEKFKQASETISQTIKEVAERLRVVYERELDVSQKDSELNALSIKIEEKVKQYTISPEEVEKQRIANEKEAAKILSREQKISNKEYAVSEREKDVEKREIEVKDRFLDIEVRENDIKNRELALIEKGKNLKDDIEKEVFAKIMK